jgi:ribosomal protein L29
LKEIKNIMDKLRKKSEVDLNKMLKEKREALRDFRFAGAGGRTRNVREGRGIRHEIAQILTALNEKKDILHNKEL